MELRKWDPATAQALVDRNTPLMNNEQMYSTAYWHIFGERHPLPSSDSLPTRRKTRSQAIHDDSMSAQVPDIMHLVVSCTSCVLNHGDVLRL